MSPKKTKCSHCKQKKARRTCPAINGMICTKCCGSHRGSGILCQSNCDYFLQHEGYQQQKCFEKDQKKWIQRDIKYIKEEKKRALSFLTKVEIDILEFVSSHPEIRDREVIDALKYLKSKLGPILTPEGPPSELSAYLLKKINRVIESGEMFRDRANEEIEKMVEFIESITSGEDDPRKYIHSLVGYLEKFQGFKKPTPDKESRIIQI